MIRVLSEKPVLSQFESIEPRSHGDRVNHGAISLCFTLSLVTPWFKEFKLRLYRKAGSIGQVATRENNGLMMLNNTLRNTPLYYAGLDINDVIISIDNHAVKSNTTV